MQQIDFYMIDAFTTTTFDGNAAAVCPLTEWLPDETLLKCRSNITSLKQHFLSQMIMALSGVGLPLWGKLTYAGMPRLLLHTSYLNILTTQAQQSILLLICRPINGDTQR